MRIPPAFIFASLLLVACIVGFAWISRRTKKGGGGATVGMVGALHEMLSSDRRRSAETILKKNKGEQEEVDPSSDPFGLGKKNGGDEERPAQDTESA